MSSGDVHESSIDKSGESGIIRKKLSDRMYNIHNETEYGIFEFSDIEDEMSKSTVGRHTMKYIEDEGLDVEMNYDLNQPDDLDGYIIGKQICVNAAHHIDETHVAETIIHECAHRQFNWVNTQEDEVNCRLYEYFHAHKTVSENTIREIVDFVRQNYSDTAGTHIEVFQKLI